MRHTHGSSRSRCGEPLIAHKQSLFHTSSHSSSLARTPSTIGEPQHDRLCRPGTGKGYLQRQYRCRFGSSSAAAMALRAACSRIKISDNTLLPLTGTHPQLIFGHEPCAWQKHVGDAVAMFQFPALALRFTSHTLFPPHPRGTLQIAILVWIPKTKRAWICGISPGGARSYRPRK